ncbi:hypothetical protein SHIRM173S_00250 [Streptomyces hirsutus]
MTVYQELALNGPEVRFAPNTPLATARMTLLTYPASEDISSSQPTAVAMPGIRKLTTGSTSVRTPIRASVRSLSQAKAEPMTRASATELPVTMNVSSRVSPSPGRARVSETAEKVSVPSTHTRPRTIRTRG